MQVELVPQVGSSPLARGAHSVRVHRSGALRLIPARAGSTMYRFVIASLLGAHPRSRGEHAKPAVVGDFSQGSSPLARGARGPGPRGRGRVRLIPARAGSTGLRPSRSRPAPAHPRSRGEHEIRSSSSSVQAGSSPLARGARPDRGGRDRAQGLIPARAGSTSSAVSAARSWWAHPRSRGEHKWRAITGATHCGSSPLARGAPALVDGGGLRGGLIPARAGSTRSGSGTFTAGSGSSPLARGALGRPRTAANVQGLIPARAGSTLARRRKRSSPRAHPRSRGEHSPP